MKRLTESNVNLNGFVSSVLENLNYLYFEIYNNGQHQSTYEGLSSRNEGIMKFFRVAKPGKAMKKTDLLRNYLLEYSNTDEEKMQFHLKYWVPIELVQQDQDVFEQNFAQYLSDQTGEELSP